MALQTLIRALYPPQCLMCETRIEETHGLCPDCRKEAEFLQGATCSRCAIPLPGDAEAGLTCDDCLNDPQPWDQGRSALRYSGTGRKLVLGLKHSDRTDIVPGAGLWMYRAAQDILTPESHVVPVPLHWSRRVKRRYNQADLLAKEIARRAGARFAPEALRRAVSTPSLDKRGREERASLLENAIAVHDEHLVAGRTCVLVDDVMTSGATLRACAKALWSGRATSVHVVTLARVAR